MAQPDLPGQWCPPVSIPTGNKKGLEEYLSQWPELAGEPQCVHDLLAHECLARAMQGEGVSNEEIHARFPTRGDPSEDDIIVWYHQPTQTIVRAVYNYFRHGQRPYDVVRYFPTEGFYGMGVCEQKEMFQTIASDLHNFNTDNVLLANSRMVVAKAAANIAPGEPFYPNKVWIVDDDINKSFGVFPMADIYQSLPLLQSQNQALGERRTGIQPEFRLGAHLRPMYLATLPAWPHSALTLAWSGRSLWPFG